PGLPPFISIPRPGSSHDLAKALIYPTLPSVMFRSSNREVELSPVSSFTCGQQQDSYDIITDQRFIKWCRVCGARALCKNFSKFYKNNFLTHFTISLAFNFSG